MSRRRSIPALVCALALGLPSGALAQSAGDDQYQDPFSGNTPSQGNSGNSGSSGGGSSQSSPQPAQSAASAPSAGAGQAQSSQGQTLPRTGFPALLPLAYGLVLLLSGAALKRGARPRIR